MRRLSWGCAALVALVGLVAAARAAWACGCFAPPDPSVPVVQAGERILFARKDGIVTAHIQIQYAGNASEFGWLLPLPSRPDLELGTDELFTQLIAQTQPRYTLQRLYQGDCFPSSGGSQDSAPSRDAGAAPGGGVSVTESSIGPYDFAVLQADSKDALLDWLADNRYFVPAGTEDVVAPYIHPGSFFLALKLRSGKSAGDLQPIVVHYASDLPMIPIILTSVAAQPDMGIQVWMLGAGRAIPRNYAHTVINDAQIDWLQNGVNYNDVIVRATKEAPGRHAFVTEFAGASDLMRNLLAPAGRFGSKDELASRTDPRAFLETVATTGYGQRGNLFGRLVYSTQLIAILSAALPMPAALVSRGVSASDFYGQPQYWLGSYRDQNPAEFKDWPPAWSPGDLAAELDSRIAEPARRAEALFAQHSYLTRLYTTLSPEQMTRDPVFSENQSLPGISNQHSGTLTFYCGDQLLSPTTPATLRTEDGWVVRYPRGTGTSPLPALPYSKRIESVAEEGAPTVMTDNSNAIAAALRTIQAIPGEAGPLGVDTGCGCASGGRVPSRLGLLLALGGLFALVKGLRSRPSSRVP